MNNCTAWTVYVNLKRINTNTIIDMKMSIQRNDFLLMEEIYDPNPHDTGVYPRWRS